MHKAAGERGRSLWKGGDSNLDPNYSRRSRNLQTTKINMIKHDVTFNPQTFGRLEALEIWIDKTVIIEIAVNKMLRCTLAKTILARLNSRNSRKPTPNDRH
jgi:hypothetical protein